MTFCIFNLFFGIVFSTTAFTQSPTTCPELLGQKSQGKIIKSWVLDSSSAFVKLEDGRFALNNGGVIVPLPSRHLSDLNNLWMAGKHPDGFIVLSTYELPANHASHLLILDGTTANVFRHKILEGAITSIFLLKDSMILMAVNDPFNGNYLELLDTKTRTHGKVNLPGPKHKAPNVTMISENQVKVQNDDGTFLTWELQKGSNETYRFNAR